MRLANIRLDDWGRGNHHNTSEDADGHLTLGSSISEGYWECEIDFLGDCYSTIKTASALHPKLANLLHGPVSDAADEVDDPETEENEFVASASGNLNWGDIVIVDCPEDPSDEDNPDVQICSYLAGGRMLFLRITPDRFTNIPSEAPALLDEIVKNIYPHGIFLDGFGSEGAVSSNDLRTIATLVRERMLLRIYAGDNPSDFVDAHSRISTQNDYFLLRDFFAGHDLAAATSQVESVAAFPGELIAEAPAGLDIIRVWTMAVLGGINYLANASRAETSNLEWPNIYCGSSWLDEEISVEDGIPSRRSDTGTFTWDYRGYPLFKDESCSVDVIRLWVRNLTNYYGQSATITIAQKNESGEYEEESEPYSSLPSYPADLDGVHRYMRIRINLSTDDLTLAPIVEYADIQIKYMPGLISRFYTTTQRMLQKFPRWMKIRELESDINALPESLGGKLINFAAGEDLSAGWEDYYWAQAQKNPATLDLGQMAWCWRVPQGFGDLYKLEATLGGRTISPIICNSTEEFLHSYPWENTCLWSTYGSLYFNRQYDSVTVNEDKYKLEDFPIYTSLDSWGAMLDLPRLRLEDNVHYYRRIYDVCVNMPTADLEGIQRGLQRELSLCDPPAMWGASPELWGATPLAWGSTTFGDPPYFGCTPTIIELHTLGPGDEEWFDTLGFATDSLKHWIRGINKRAGVTFDTMQSGKVTWDMAGPEGEALGYLPLRFDSNPVAPFGWHDETPETPTPWWNADATPVTPGIFNPGVMEYGVGDGDDLLVVHPVPSVDPEEFTVSIYVDGIHMESYVYCPTVEIPWQARGIGRISLYDPQPQAWALTVFATESATPDPDPTTWEYYSVLSGETQYNPKTKFFNSIPETPPVNTNQHLYNLINYMGSSGPSYSGEWEWETGPPNPINVTAYALANGAWSESGWEPDSNNSSVDVWWEPIPSTPLGVEGETLAIDLTAATPLPLGNIVVASNDIGPFLANQRYFTDYASTPPGEDPVPFGPHAHHGRVFVNGVSGGDDPSLPGSHDVEIRAPIFYFHPNCRDFTWEIQPSATDAIPPDIGNLIGYTVDKNLEQITTTQINVVPDTPVPYDEMTSTATFSSGYSVAAMKRSPWRSEQAVTVTGKLYSEYNPKIWSARRLLVPEQFGITADHYPQRFYLASSPDNFRCWMTDPSALSLDEASDATPLEVMVNAGMKDYGSIEWNPRIHSGFFYMPHNERYLYADCRHETFTSCSEEDNSVMLSDLPRAGAPVIVVDNLGRSWRKVTSWEYQDGLPVLTSTINHEVSGNGTNVLYAAYRGIRETSVTDITLSPSKTYSQDHDFTVVENEIRFAEDFITNPNHRYTISYVPRLSFFVDTQVEEAGKQLARLYLSESFEGAGIEDITIFYEGSTADPYYTEDTIRLSPLLTYWQRAFIFMQGREQTCTEVKLFASPGAVEANGLDWCIVHVVSLDANGNPVGNVPIVLDADMGTLADSVLVTNEEGFAATTWTSPSRVEVESPITTGRTDPFTKADGWMLYASGSWLSFYDAGWNIQADYAYDEGSILCSIRTVGETPPAHVVVSLTLPVERGYSIDARTATGVRTLMSDGISKQRITVTVLDEELEPISGKPISRIMWTSLDSRPVATALGNTNAKGVVVDSILSSDIPRQVFAIYCLTEDVVEDPVNGDGCSSNIKDTISWTEYEVYNYPEA